MASVVSKKEVNRRRMLLELGKSELAKPDRKQMFSALGYEGSKSALDPARKRAPVDNTHLTFQKWIQAALNIILGINLKRDGVLQGVTRTAIRRFQIHEGLTAHGYIDEATLQVIELRAGMEAPRSSRHESLPHLLRLPRKGIWKPHDRDKKGQGSERKGHEEGAESEAGGLAGKVAPGVQQREAEHAVAAVAFDDDFVAMAAAEKDTNDLPGLRYEMSDWLQQAYLLGQEECPGWLTRVRFRARAEPTEAASIVRRQWWHEHAGGDEP